MSSWTWSKWTIWSPISDRDIPDDIRPGMLAQADLIVRPGLLGLTRHPSFIRGFRFIVIDGAAWMPAPPATSATTHIVTRYRVRRRIEGSLKEGRKEVMA